MSRLLLVGGGGFLGSALLEGLQHAHVITCVDRGSRYERFASASTSITLVRGDERDVAALLREATFDKVAYLAGGNAARLARSDAERDAEAARARGALHTILSALPSGETAPALVYFSSYLCYAPSPNLLAEDAPTCVTPYAQLHLDNEDAIRASCARFTIIRLASVYGRYGFTRELQAGGVLGRFVALTVAGKAMRLDNGGVDGMDFLNIDDFVGACDAIVRRPCVGATLNLATGRLTRLLELARHITDAQTALGGAAVPPAVAPVASGYVPQTRHCANDAFRAAYGWRPAHDLRASVGRLLADELDRANGAYAG